MRTVYKPNNNFNGAWCAQSNFWGRTGVAKEENGSVINKTKENYIYVSLKHFNRTNSFFITTKQM